jgi:hypothetical protein
MRIILIDGSFIDVWFSLKLKGRYSTSIITGRDGPSMVRSIDMITLLIDSGNLYLPSLVISMTAVRIV